MATEPKKLGPTIRPMIESILKKSLDNKTLSPDAYEKAIRKLDLVDKKAKKGGQMKKKKKKKFPDLNNDGKVTMKDILIGRGVIKKAKVGMQMKGTSPLIKKR
jgi:hypothetical protein